MKSELEKQQEAIDRKIGRNIVLLQRVELALKYFVPRACLSVSFNHLDPPAFSPQDQVKQQEAIFAHKTMGCVSRLFCERILTEPKSFPDSGEISKGEMRLKFGINLFSGSTDVQNSFETRLNSIVEDRNRIVHQLFTTFDLFSLEGLGELDSFLDQQHSEALSMFKDLRSLKESLHETLRMMADSSFSIAPNDSLKCSCVQLLIVNLLLYPMALGKSNATGWTSLAASGQYIHQQCPGALSECKEKYGTDSLKNILKKTELFDLIDEVGAVFYRIKPEYWVEVDKERNLFLCKNTPHGLGGEGVLKQELDITMTVEDRHDSIHPSH